MYVSPAHGVYEVNSRADSTYCRAPADMFFSPPAFATVVTASRRLHDLNKLQ